MDANKPLNKINVLPLHVGEAVHEGDWNWKHVRSPFARMYFVTEGEAIVYIEDSAQKVIKHIHLTPNHLYYIPPYTMHSYECKGHFVHYYIHAYEDPKQSANLLCELELPNEIQSLPVDCGLFARLCEIYPQLKLEASNPASYDNWNNRQHNLSLTNQSDECDRMEASGILYILLSRFLRLARMQPEMSDKRIPKVLNYIRRNIDKTMTVSELSDLIYTSRDHFIRIFKETTGDTPIVYIAKRKVERAELLLLTTNLPVKTIAGMLDYIDNAYFIRVFKKYTGTTPQQYRLSLHK